MPANLCQFQARMLKQCPLVTDLNSRVPLSWKQPHSLFLIGLVASCCPGVVHLRRALTGSRF